MIEAPHTYENGYEVLSCFGNKKVIKIRQTWYNEYYEDAQ